MEVDQNKIGELRSVTKLKEKEKIMPRFTNKGIATDYVYKVNHSYGNPVFFFDIKDVQEHIKILSKATYSKPEDFHIVVCLQDKRVLRWNDLDYDVHKHFEHNLVTWIQAGMPDEVPEEEYEGPEELAQ